jgi:hypothetical protein
LLELARQELRFRRSPHAGQHEDHVRHDARVQRFAVERITQCLLRLGEIAMALVDETERVVRAQERGFVRYRRTRPPVRVVEVAGGERLGGPVVHVHRNDGLLADGSPDQAARVLRRHEVDRHQVLLAFRPDVAASIAQDQIDVPNEEFDVAASAQRFIGDDALELDRQSQLLGQRPGHDDERQAVAAARSERLRGVAGHDGVVIELELTRRVERLEQAVP